MRAKASRARRVPDFQAPTARIVSRRTAEAPPRSEARSSGLRAASPRVDVGSRGDERSGDIPTPSADGGEQRRPPVGVFFLELATEASVEQLRHDRRRPARTAFWRANSRKGFAPAASGDRTMATLRPSSAASSGLRGFEMRAPRARSCLTVARSRLRTASQRGCTLRGQRASSSAIIDRLPSRIAPKRVVLPSRLRAATAPHFSLAAGVARYDSVLRAAFGV